MIRAQQARKKPFNRLVALPIFLTVTTFYQLGLRLRHDDNRYPYGLCTRDHIFSFRLLQRG